MDILIVTEQNDGKLHRMSLEAIAAAQAFARDLSLSTAILVLGADTAAVAQQAAGMDVGEVLNGRHDLLEVYNNDLYREALVQVINQASPRYVFLGHTYQARDLLPKASARLHSPYLSDVVGYEVNDGTPTWVKQVFNGRLATRLTAGDQSKPCMVGFQAAAFAADAVAGGNAQVREIPLTLEAGMAGTKPEAPFRESGERVDLGAANLIVSIGRGLGTEDNLPMVRDLAEALGAQLACSRPVVDAGWLPATHQVGSSGQTVGPKLYLALGISGSAQHLVGMKGSKHIVAVNKDPEAPIFDVADYGVVADLLEIVPKLTEAVKAVQ